MSETFDLEAARVMAGDYRAISGPYMTPVVDMLAAACDEVERVKVERDAAIKALEQIAAIQDHRAYICGDEDGKCYWDHAESIALAALRQARGEERS